MTPNSSLPGILTRAETAMWNEFADGNNPIHRDEFEQHYYRGPDDDQLNGAINTVEEGNILMNNHSLIASNSEDNTKALENMRKLVRQ